ncbi:MAG: methyltransferase domain-containing protein [Bacteroidetes bacterium]|nr:MAG: methyltransferase domain-containing protein [Bacteroidota bacterium]
MNPDFSARSSKKELLDEPHIPKQDLFRNLFELNVINRILGGHAVTLKGLQKLQLNKHQTYRILDIGCGGGDTLKAVANWGRKNGHRFLLTGVDLKPDCIEYATEFCKNYPEINFILADYRALPELQQEFDVVITSLFCHHLSNEELFGLFSWCNSQAKIGFVMNDLHRHPLAYYSIAMLTKLFSKSYLVKNDAKLSVLRGFKHGDLLSILNHLPTHSSLITLNWVWAFRWLLVLKHHT